MHGELKVQSDAMDRMGARLGAGTAAALAELLVTDACVSVSDAWTAPVEANVASMKTEVMLPRRSAVLRFDMMLSIHSFCGVCDDRARARIGENLGGGLWSVRPSKP